MTELKKVLMNRDGLTSEEADNVIQEMQNQIFDDGDDPETVLEDIGLEPDYLEDLLI